MEFRAYEPSDLDAVMRIHDECGWPAETDAHREATSLWQGCNTSLVALVNGAAECFASNADATMRYLEETLPLCVVGGVATSHVARRLGLATRLTAEAIAHDVIEKRMAAAVLGMFDQGFYDRLGFGSGGYDPMTAFDPGDLCVEPPQRPPVRLAAQDAERVHASRAASIRRHGAITLESVDYTRGDMLCSKNGFGLGFEGENGEITHHLWCSRDERGQGPYHVRWVAYRSGAQFRELMGVLKTFGEQVHLVRMVEPPDIQLWDLLERPWRRRVVSLGSKQEAFVRGFCWWQVRICDLAACLDATKLPSAESVRFNLTLSDPIAACLTDHTARRWSGVAGDYVVTLGPESRAERRAPEADLPTMRTSVNTFSRLWLGVKPPTGLAVTAPDLDAPVDLLERLDRVVRVPRPALDWDI